jgi:putative copper resistance protein D
MPAVRALHLAALALLAGGFAFPLFVLPTSAAAQSERWVLHRWYMALRFSGAFLALGTWAAWLALVAVAVSGLPAMDALRPAVLGLVAQTRFGQVWLIRLLLMLLLVAWLAWPRRGQAPPANDADVAGSALAACVLVSQAWAGHATAAPLSHVALDALHLVAAALWIGSLPPLIAVLARARAGASASTALAAAAARGFTNLGTFAVGTLALTGLINGRLMVGSLHALANSGYGRLIAAKLVLFAAMLAFAAASRFRVAPRLRDANPQSRAAAHSLWRNVAIELALGACMLAIVGVLGGSPPPGAGV